MKTFESIGIGLGLGDDMGKIIGKQGNTINAIRGLLQAGSAKVNTRCVLEVSELEA